MSRPRVNFQSLWDEGVDVLTSRDPLLSPVLSAHRGERLRPSPDALTTLANAIVGQQISVHAAESVWSRLVERYGRSRILDPQRLGQATTEDLRACGLSRKKAEFLLAAADAFERGDLADGQWKDLPDREVFERLQRLPGVGPWTAHMVMIFHLGRLDVLPTEDLGLLKAFRAVCGAPHDARDAKRALQERAEHLWRPYRTVATWYLWRYLDPVPVAY